MRRWIKRILLLLVLPLLVVVVGIQLVLWSDLPRSYLRETLERQLGFRASIGRLETGWSGQTTLEDVTLQLPMQAEPFLTVARLEVAHSSLPRMLLGGPTIRTIHISELQIRLERDEHGSWNLQRVWADVQASPLWRDSTSGGDPWPRLEIERARLVLKDPNKPDTLIEPIGLHGRMNESRAWEFSGELPGQLTLNGQIAPAGVRHHRLAVAVEPALSRELSGWLPGELVPAALEARWVGQIGAGALRGKLDIKNLQLGPTRIQGRLQLDVRDDHIQIAPDNLILTDAERFTGPLMIGQGICRLEGTRLLVQEVVAEHAGVLGRITGRWDLASAQGRFEGTWLAAAPEAPTRHQGEYDIRVHNPPRGRKDVQVHLNASGQAAGGRWQAEITARGFGPQWRQSQWLIEAPRLQWADRGHRFRLDQVQGQLQVDRDRVDLLELKAPAPIRLEARGDYTFADGRWSLELTAAGVAVEGLDPNRVDVQIHSRGDPNRIHIARLELRHPLARADITGSILLPTLQLENIRARATGTLPQESLAAASALESLQGSWRLDGLIAGGLRPAALQLQGKLTGTHLAWQKRPLDDLEIPWQGRYDPNERRLAFETEPFSGLDGRWKVAGHYGLDNASGDVRVQARRIPLQSLCRVAKPELAAQAVLSA
ncbi:MAG: hypothetical protein JW810_04685, partial [Sedimentisphaerales bacterium]|nr:hypothetical protein [Sedimentisphaerales bacterium]